VSVAFMHLRLSRSRIYAHISIASLTDTEFTRTKLYSGHDTSPGPAALDSSEEDL